MRKSLRSPVRFAAMVLAASWAPGALASSGAPVLESLEAEAGALESASPWDAAPEAGNSMVAAGEDGGQLSSIQGILGGVRSDTLSPANQRKLKRIVNLLGRVQRIALRPITGPRARRMARLLLRIQRIALKMAVTTGPVASVSERKDAAAAVVAGRDEQAHGERAGSGVGL